MSVAFQTAKHCRCWPLCLTASHFLQGVGYHQFLCSGLQHDVGTLLFSPSDILVFDAHAERRASRGAEWVKWGKLVTDTQSHLDVTAEMCGCHLWVTDATMLLTWCKVCVCAKHGSAARLFVASVVEHHCFNYLGGLCGSVIVVSQWLVSMVASPNCNKCQYAIARERERDGYTL